MYLIQIKLSTSRYISLNLCWERFICIKCKTNFNEHWVNILGNPNCVKFAGQVKWIKLVYFRCPFFVLKMIVTVKYKLIEVPAHFTKSNIQTKELFNHWIEDTYIEYCTHMKP